MQFAYLGAAGSQMPDLVSVDSDSATNLAATSMTFNSVSLGPENSRRRILVIAFASDAIANSNTMTSITVNGNAATSGFYAVSDSSLGNSVDVMMGRASFDLPTGTSATIVVNFNTTLSTSGSTYIHVFSLSDTPSSWSFSGGGTDTIPSGTGSFIPTGTPASSVRTIIYNAVWEGAHGQNASQSPYSDVEIVDLDVGTATDGFHCFIAIEYVKATAGSSRIIAIDAYTAGDAGVGGWSAYFKT
jgi:hypothetical protein